MTLYRENENGWGIQNLYLTSFTSECFLHSATGRDMNREIFVCEKVILIRPSNFWNVKCHVRPYVHASFALNYGIFQSKYMKIIWKHLPTYLNVHIDIDRMKQIKLKWTDIWKRRRIWPTAVLSKFLYSAQHKKVSFAITFPFSCLLNSDTEEFNPFQCEKNAWTRSVALMWTLTNGCMLNVKCKIYRIESLCHSIPQYHEDHE